MLAFTYHFYVDSPVNHIKVLANFVEQKLCAHQHIFSLKNLQDYVGQTMSTSSHIVAQNTLNILVSLIKLVIPWDVRGLRMPKSSEPYLHSLGTQLGIKQNPASS